MNKLWCMPCVWRNCYQCIDFALLCFHNLSSWYSDLWFYSLNHLKNLWHYLPKWCILSFLYSLWNSSYKIFHSFFEDRTIESHMPRLITFSMLGLRRNLLLFSFIIIIFFSNFFLYSCISLYHCRNKGIKFNDFPYL